MATHYDSVEPSYNIPGLITALLSHQRRGVTAIINTARTSTKGLVVADPPGYDKALVMLCAIAKESEINGPNLRLQAMGQTN